VDAFLEAVNLAQELNIDMPEIPTEWDTMYKQYKMKSTNEIMAGYVGAIDRFVQHFTQPASKEVANVGAFHS
jgi:nitrate/nitrite-specific signal transduction histidine kinase